MYEVAARNVMLDVVMLFVYLIERHRIDVHSQLFHHIEMWFTIRGTTVGVNLEYFDHFGKLVMVKYVEVTVIHDAEFHAVELYAKALELAQSELAEEYEIVEVAA